MPVACAIGIITVNARRSDRYSVGMAHRLGGVRAERRGLAPEGGAAALERRFAGHGEVGRCPDRVAGGGLIYSLTDLQVLVEYAESRQNLAKRSPPTRLHAWQCQARQGSLTRSPRRFARAEQRLHDACIHRVDLTVAVDVVLAEVRPVPSSPSGVVL